ncbi:hypothetical protein VNI00_003705 [Paramarasmius palmivorus]|uniref:PITH domain-containing protein n=1 Tax=Paramarasmius palmivorus TaxID=297713 RepID=A0AAW0DUD0_9AGAR
MSTAAPQLNLDLSSIVDPIFYGALIAIWLSILLKNPFWNMFITDLDLYSHQRRQTAHADYSSSIHSSSAWSDIRASLLVFACTLLNGLMLHHYFIVNFGNILALTHITPELSAFTLLTLLVIVLSDLCFASRVWRLQRVHWAFTVIIVATAIGALIPGITMVKAIFTKPSVPALNSTPRKIEVGFINILAALSQCLATAALWWSFRAHMSEVVTTQTMLQKLSIIALNRGVLLTVCQLMVAFMYFYHPERFYWAPFHQALAPLYFMTMLSTLNARTDFRDKKDLSIAQTDTNIFGAGTYHGENDIPVTLASRSYDPRAGIQNLSLLEAGYGSSRNLVRRDVGNEKEKEKQSGLKNSSTAFLVVNNPNSRPSAEGYNPYQEVKVDNSKRERSAESLQKQAPGQESEDILIERGQSRDSVHVSLLEFLDLQQLNCLNESPDHPLKPVVESKSLNNSPEKFLQSDADEQLLLNIAFNQTVRVKSIIIKSEDVSKAPKLIKLAVNKPSLGFEDVADANEPAVAQILELSEEDVKGKPIQLRFVRFQSVNSLHIFVASNQGDEEETVINAIDVIGVPVETTKDLSGLKQQENS